MQKAGCFEGVLDAQDVKINIKRITLPPKKKKQIVLPLFFLILF